MNPKGSWALVLALCSGLFAVEAVRPSAAGGLLLSPAPAGERWEVQEQSGQQAYIDYRGGVERLLIDVSAAKPKGRGMLLIFPVPAKPEDVFVRALRAAPEPRGREVVSRARSAAERTIRALILSQVQILPQLKMTSVKWSELYFGLFSGFGSPGRLDPAQGLDDAGVPAAASGAARGGAPGEVVAAGSADDLSRYLGAKGFKGKAARIKELDRYIGQGYCFVASWMGPAEEGPLRRGLLVSFPADRIFFPLLPLSADPATIRVSGFVTPVLDPALRGHSKTGYYSRRGLRYTKIELDAPARLLSGDIWMEAKAPALVRRCAFLARRPLELGFAFLIAGSLAAGLLLGWLVFEQWRNPKGVLKMGALALSNCFGGIGLLAACAAVPSKPLCAERQAELGARKDGGLRRGALHWFYRASDGRKLLYAAFFPVAFMLSLEFLSLCLFGRPPRGALAEPAARTPPLLSWQPLSLALLSLVWSARVHIDLSLARDGFVRFQRFSWAVLKTIALLYALALMVKFSILLYLPHFVYELPAAAGFTGLDWWLLCYSIPLSALLLLPALALSLVGEDKEAAWLKAALGTAAAAALLAKLGAGPSPAAWVSGAYALLTLACLGCRRLHRRLYAGEREAQGAYGAVRALLALLVLGLAGNVLLRTPNFYWSVGSLARALGGDDQVVAAFANGILHKLPQRRTAPAMIPFLDAKDEFVRRVALELLGGSGQVPPEALPALARIARLDGDDRVRRLALQALFLNGTPQAAAALRSVLERDPQPELRASAAWALSRIDPGGAPALLAQALRRPENRPIQSALRSMLDSAKKK